MQYSVWQTMQTEEKNAYIWASDIYEGSKETGNWGRLYQKIFYANVALEGIDKIQPSAVDQLAWNNIKGSALFYRAHAFFSLGQLYAKQYDATTASSDPGIPLKLSADINEKVGRGTVEQTYQQIINDLTAARNLLPVNPAYTTRPSLPAVFGLLANTYLVMGDYDKALLYSDSCLQLKNSLIDYNTLTVTSGNYPFPVFQSNNEIIYHAEVSPTPGSLIPPRAIVDSNLYQLYSINDLRRTVFYQAPSGLLNFYGSYTQFWSLQSGLNTDEMYLVRAECKARKGNTGVALTDLNTLLIKRWKNSVPYIPVTAIDAEDALRKILTERRKELAFRCIRWWDLRRLNKDPRFTVTLTRVLNGHTYTLPPNDPKYVLPIPDAEILLTGIEQNPR
jgi:tetratricopeptide (TPR) repeat protein